MPEVIRAFSQGGRVVHSLAAQGGRFSLTRPGPGGGPVTRIDRFSRILLRDPQETGVPLLGLEVMPTTSSRLSVENGGSEVAFRFQIRCLLNGLQAWVQLQGGLHFEPTGVVGFDSLVLMLPGATTARPATPQRGRLPQMMGIEWKFGVDRRWIEELFGLQSPGEGDAVTVTFEPRRSASDQGPRHGPLFSWSFPNGGRRIAVAAGSFPNGVPLRSGDRVVLRQALPPLWNAEQFAPDGSAEWLVTLSDLTAESICPHWNEAFAVPHLASLRTVQDALPASFVPTLEHRASTPQWTLFYEVRDARADRETLEEDEIAAGSPVAVANRIAIYARSLQPVLGTAGEVDAVLPNCRTHSGDPLRLACLLAAPEDPAVDDPRRPGGPFLALEGMHFRLRPRQTAGGAGATLRFGALDLVVPGQGLEAGGSFEVGAAMPARRETGDPAGGLYPRMELAADLALLDLRPGGQDEVPGPSAANGGDGLFEREPPLVIPFDPPAAAGPAGAPPFLLVVEERTADGRSQELQLNLRHVGVGGEGSAGEVRHVVVLDRQPLLVALAEVASFRGQNTDGLTNEIGNWSSSGTEGATWELRGTAEKFALRLPPQAVGESMEKGRDVGEGVPADFRFSPLTRFTLRPSYFKQRFAEPPWNLRRILGYPGQRAPGAGIVDLRFELLYGLTAAVDYPFLRLAEIAARQGRLAGGLRPSLPWPALERQEKVYDEFRLRWEGTVQRYLSRLAVLEPWDEHQPRGLTLTEGISYAFRRSAQLRYPIAGPVPGEVPADFDPLWRDVFRPDGLAGGVTWGFESRNILEAVLREPRSTSGKLAAPFFSALGGWGYQKASFDKDRSTIYANTAMGRAFFYSVERIGRIAGYWNLAKHVVIYERTVARRRQFRDEQNSLEGRPVVRKVREFVEILEPVRHYPDFGAAEVTRGFVVSCEFKSRIINVTSRWGSDVGREGWQIPLWRPDAQPADVYPKPHVVLEVAADEGTGAPTVQVAIDEPEKLIFFTSTRADTDARPDLWPAVPGIDFPYQTGLGRPGGEELRSGTLARQRADAQPVEEGYGRFTYRLAPAARPVNLVAERAGRPMSAVLENVTMVRGVPRRIANEPLRQAAGEVERLADRAERELAGALARWRVETPPDVQAWKDEVRRFLAGLSRDLGAGAETLETARKALAGGSREVCAQLRDRADWVFERGRRQVMDEVGRLRGLLEAEVRRLLGQAGELTEEVRRELETGINRVFDGLEEALRVLEQRIDEVRGFQNEIDRQVGEVQTEIRRLQEWITAQTALRRAELLARLDALQRTVETVLEQARSAAEVVRGTFLESLATRLLGLLAPAGQGMLAGIGRLRQEIAAVPDPIPPETGATIVEALDDVRELLASLVAELNRYQSVRQWLAGSRTRLLAEVRDASHTTREALRQACEALIAETLGAEAEIDRRLGELKNQLLAEVARLCREFAGQLDQLAQRVLALLPAAEIQAFLDCLPETAEEIERELRELVAGAEATVREYTGAAASAIQDLVQDALRDVSDNTLRLLRACGRPPEVPALRFNAGRIAYVFAELAQQGEELGASLLKAVATSPVVALVNDIARAAEQRLQALGLRIPTTELLDRILPMELPRFNLSEIFPDFAGLKLDNLFPGLKMPAIANDNVKVSHGVDPEARRAWVEAEVEVPVSEPATLFSFGPVTLRLRSARFRGRARIEVAAGESPRKVVRAVLAGDWELQVGGLALVVFRDTALFYEDGGRIRFALSPDKVELQAGLRFLADLMARFEYSGSGFSIRVLEEGGRPVGVQSLLDLPLPDVQMGAIGISNLRLGAGLALELRGGDFTVALHLNLGRKIAPFTLTIFILGGGGWVDVAARYTPSNGLINTRVTVGIVASASLAIALGPIRGGVWVQFGIYAEFERSSNGAGSGLVVAAMLLIRGEVSLLGIVSIGVSLLLEARYHDTGRLVARGTFHAHVKICWFYSIEVTTQVEYVLNEGGGGRPEQIERSTDQYVAMLE